MKAVIVDDERPALEMLRVMLEMDGRLEVAKAYLHPVEALEGITAIMPDIVFLDVDMPVMNGVELGKRIKAWDENIQLVFVTAYSEYALPAIRLDAADYLLKPLSVKTVGEAVTRVFKRAGATLRAEALPPANSTPERTGNRGILPPIRGLGDFVLAGTDGHPVKWRSSKSRELLAFLLVQDDAPVSKWRIIIALWPECTEKQALTNLHTAVYRLKKTLEESRTDYHLHYASDQYHIELDSHKIDWKILEQFCKAHPDTESCEQQECREVLELYKGELFGSYDYPWSVSCKERYLAYYRNLSMKWGERLLAEGQLPEARQTVQRLLVQAPLFEAGHKLLLRILAAKGDREGLISQYKRLEQMLRTELGVAPSEQTQKLFRILSS